MISTRNLHKQSIKTLYSLIQHPKPIIYTHPFPNYPPETVSIHQKAPIFTPFSNKYELGMRTFTGTGMGMGWNWLDRKWMSTARGRSMRSKVEKRMQRESGKNLRQIRQAKRLKLKLMTEEERMLHSLRRAKKKVAVLLQQLKKFELPELPPPRHDPELLTVEQLQAYKKIGFKNKNYCQVGVRGVFGGVVLNMHMHWKFHETVQILCDNYPKEKIKEMAIILARLSGGIVVNIHNVKTIIMYRGRNYRQPKLMTPLNTLTKRKALFKARFEQALESQKLNIKKTEQQLRRKGVNPEDPVAMASIQRVASTFFNAIDNKEESPYVFRENGESEGKIGNFLQQNPEAGEDSDQEELDKFISQIEDAAEKEFEEEEAAEQQEVSRIQYWNTEGPGGSYRPERYMHNDFDGEARGRAGGYRDTYQRKRRDGSESEGDSDGDGDGDGDGNDASDDDENESLPRRDSGGDQYKHPRARVERRNEEITRGRHENRGFNRSNDTMRAEESRGEEMLGEIDDVMWNSDREEENPSIAPRIPRSETRGGRNYGDGKEVSERVSESDYSDQSDDGEGYSDSEPLFEEDDTLESGPLAGADEDYNGIGEASFYHSENEDGPSRGKRVSKKNDEVWDSD